MDLTKLGIGSLLVLQVLLNIHLQRTIEPNSKHKTEVFQSGSRLQYSNELVKSLSVGHLMTAVDWMWLSYLIGVSPHEALDQITDLDPAFYDAHIFGAELRSVIHGDGEGAKRLLLKAEKFAATDSSLNQSPVIQREWSNPGAIQLLLAYVYLFDLENLPQAARAYQRASESPGAPPYLKALSHRLSKSEGRYEVGLSLLRMLHREAKDSQMRDRLQDKIQSLQVSHFLFELQSKFDVFRLRQENRQATLALWDRFLRDRQIHDSDPWGGRLSLNESGKVASTTPHVSVFHLD